ncbi:MAG: type II secretion system F family protein [Bacteroidetes bacterium]|nr:MAG: type II secretion system F family protein [Bacteroidota bacterium]
MLKLIPLLAPLINGVSVGLLAYLFLRFLQKLPQYAVRKERIVLPLTFKVFLPVARYFAPKLRNRPSFKEVLEQLDQKIIMAGLTQTFTPEEFLALRFVIGIVFSVISLFMLTASAKSIFFLGIAFFLFAWIYPGLWLANHIRERHRSIQRALPNVLDLLTLSVEAGRDFLTALREILRNREPDPLGEELEQVFREVQLGKQRRVALQAMANRVRQPDLESVVETLVQADQLGVSIGYILRILAEQMRQKRFAYAEKKANEAPVKMLLPLFIFIFPAVLIIIIGPVLYKTLQSGNLF